MMFKFFKNNSKNDIVIDPLKIPSLVSNTLVPLFLSLSDTAPSILLRVTLAALSWLPLCPKLTQSGSLSRPFDFGEEPEATQC